jgi:hypothetical protein
MGSPGRRRRAGHHWLRTLIDRAPGGRSRRTEEALARLLAEPAEDDWPDHSDAERQLDDSAGGWPADPAAYQWLGGWTDEPAPRRLLDGAPGLGWSAGAAARRRRASRPSRLGRISQRDWYLTLARYRWYVAVSAGAGAMALASGVILLLPHHPGRAMMADATTAPRVTGTQPASTAPRQAAASPGPDVRAQPATPAPAASTAAPAATGPVATTPASTAPGFVAVTYRLVEHWSGGIIGKYTIANESNAVLSGWRFSATFPGDQVQFVIGAADPDLGSDVLVLEPASAGAQLAPGARISVIFFAAGPAGSPVTCSFNRRAC